MHWKNEEYAERNFYFQQCLGNLKGQYSKKNPMGINTGLGWTVHKFDFLVILNIFLLSAYMKKTHNGEKGRKNEHISVNNGQPGIILKILYFYTRWVGLIPVWWR